MRDSKRNKISLLLAIALGAIGSVGQSYLLYHELADCLPYKVVDGEAYTSIATVGLWVAPLVAVSVGVLFVSFRSWLPLVLPVALSPLIFAILFTILSEAYGLNASNAINKGGDFTASKAAGQFFSYCFSLALIGTGIGGVLALGLNVLRRSSPLP